MKTTTKNRICLFLLALLAVAGFLWASALESEIVRNANKEADEVHAIYFDDQRILTGNYDTEY